MEIKENNFTRDEIELIKSADGGDELYDKSHLAYLCKQLVIDKAGEETNKGFFKVYIYKDSLRFLIYMVNSPSEKAVDWLADEVGRYADRNKITNIMLRYAQVNGFSNALIDRFKNSTNLYHYRHYYIAHNNINPDVDIIGMKGLEKRRCTEDMIDSCIEILEEVFTPFPDAPGSFIQDKERIKKDYLSENGGAELFFKNGLLIGLCGHNHGHFTEVCVRGEYQGKGYGEIIVRSALKSVYELGYNAELYAGNDNTRAIRLYEKVGFKKMYEAVRVNLIST